MHINNIKNIFFLLLFLKIFSQNLAANNSLSIQNISLNAAYMADGSVIVSLADSETDIIQYVNDSNISKIQIELYSKLPEVSGLANMLSNDILLNSSQIISDVDLNTWTMIVDGQLMEYEDQGQAVQYELVAIILVDDEACKKPVIVDINPYVPYPAATCGAAAFESDCPGDMSETPVQLNTSYSFRGLDLEVLPGDKAILHLPFGGFMVELNITEALFFNGCNEIVRGVVEGDATDASGLLATQYVTNKKSLLFPGGGAEICLPPPPPPAETEEDPEVNQDALNYVNENIGSLTASISSAATNLTSEINGLISTKSIECDSIRTDMDGIINDAALGIPETLIKGDAPDFKYFSEGLSEHFIEAPSLIQNQIERVPEIIQLESHHVDLYNCDVELTQLNIALSGATSLPSNYIEIILYQISLWTGYELNLYSTDSEKFNEWIIAQLALIAAGDLTETGNFRSSSDPVLSYVSDEELTTELNSELAEVFRVDVSDRFQPSVVVSTKKSGIKETIHLFNESFNKNGYLINGVDRVYYERDIAEKSKRLKSMNGDVLTLPISLFNQNSSKPYNIILEKIEISALLGARITSAIVIEDTKNGQDIIFRGENLVFGPGGFESELDSKLSLAEDYTIRLNNAAALHLLTNSDPDKGTYVTWNCEGFQSIRVESEVEFCPDFVKMVNPDGTVNQEEHYRLEVDLQIDNWNDFHIGFSASEPFVLTKYETVTWRAEHIVLDFSTALTDPNGVIFGYESPFLNPVSNTLENEWEGFYVQGLEATIPGDFTGDVGEGMSEFIINVDLAIIDDTGFTGRGGAGGNPNVDLISIGEGNLNGWAFSVNNFQLEVIQNNFAGTSFGGEIQLPILNEPLTYTADIYPDDIYEFTVGGINGTRYSELFKAELSLTNSEITISKDELGFHTTAYLNGGVAFDAGLTSASGFAELSIPDVKFEGLKLQNRAPYLNAGIWDTDGNLGGSIGGFSITLDDIDVAEVNDPLETGIDFNLLLVLNENGDEDMSISAEGAFGIVGRMNQAGGRQRWLFDRFEMHGLGIDAPIGTIAHIRGELAWENNNDPMWGNFVRGGFEVELNAVADITVSGIGQFGSMPNGDKYFYVDVLSSLPVDIPAGPIQFNGLGLGLYRNMTYDNTAVNVDDLLSPPNSNAGTLISSPGESLTSGVYAYQADISFGIKGIAQFKAANERLVNGTIGIGAEFSGTSIQKLYLDGTVQFLADLNNDLPSGPAPSNPNAPTVPGMPGKKIPLAAYAAFRMDFGQNKFTGDLAAYLNTPLIYGSSGMNNDGKLVDGKIHFAPNEWYIKLGKPGVVDPAAITIDIAPVPPIRATAYFQVGTDTDPMSDVPQQVLDLAYTASRNESLMTSGQGMVAGAKLEIDGGIGVDGLVQVDVHAIAGFDVMLRNYQGVSCSNGPNAGEEIGINGWYATGQLYALLEGTLSVFGVNILSAGVAALIQAQMPNPFFADATVGVRAQVGPLVVRKSLTLTLGETCVLQGDTPAAVFGAEVVSAITPGDHELDVSVVAQPTAYFNFPLGQNFTMANFSGGTSTFRVDFESVEISGGISAYTEVSDDKMSLKIFPYTSFPESNEVTITVNVKLYQDGSPVPGGIQSKYVTFTTGERIENIPASNVKYAYPFNEMDYYYKDQFQNNFIELNAGQRYLFEGQEVIGILKSQGRLNPNALIATLGGSTYPVSEIEIPINYNISNNKIEYQLPSEALSEEKYLFQVVRVTASGEREVLHTIRFGVSAYDSFEQVVQELEDSYNSTSDWYSLSDEHIFTVKNRELLDVNLNIGHSVERDFLEQFDQFDKCFLCFNEVAEFLACYEVPDFIFRIKALRVGYESNYRNLHSDLRALIDDCVTEICGDSSQGVPTECDSDLDGGFGFDDGCEIDNFQDLPSGTYRINLKYQIPGGQSFEYNINHQF